MCPTYSLRLHIVPRSQVVSSSDSAPAVDKDIASNKDDETERSDPEPLDDFVGEISSSEGEPAEVGNHAADSVGSGEEQLFEGALECGSEVCIVQRGIYKYTLIVHLCLILFIW